MKIRKRYKVKRLFIKIFYCEKCKNCLKDENLKQIHKYTYNGMLENESKVFLYDLVCEKFVRFKCRSGEIIFRIRSKIVNKKKEWLIVAVLFVTRILGLPEGLPAIKFDFPVSSNTSVERVLDISQGGAMGLPLPPAPVVRVQPSSEYSLKKPEFAKLVPRKPDRVIYKVFYKSKQELLLLMYATDPQLASNQQILKLVRDLRDGS